MAYVVSEGPCGCIDADLPVNSGLAALRTDASDRTHSALRQGKVIERLVALGLV